MDSAITVSIPAQTEFVLVARMAAAAVGSIADWNIDDIEDLKLAVTESCAHLLTLPDLAPALIVQITMSDGGADVLIRADAPSSSSAPEPETLAKQVVSALAADVSFDAVDGAAAIRFRKEPASVASAG